MSVFAGNDIADVGKQSGQVEERVTRVPQAVLHIVPEDPEEDHVPQDMAEAAVDEEGGE